MKRDYPDSAVYITPTMKEIEELTGFKFFRNLDPAVADAVKSQKNLADW